MTRPQPRIRLLAMLLVASVAAACSSAESGPHALTTDEAQRLALARYNNYVRKYVDFTATVPISGSTTHLVGRIGFHVHIGYAASTTQTGQNSLHGLLQWDLRELAYLPNTAAAAGDPPPPGNWAYRPLRQQGSALDGALLLMLNLASDRPENPQLLRQSSAQWLRRDSAGGVSVDVFTGPEPRTGGGDSRLRYWIDDNGTMRKAEARVGNEDWSDFEFLGGAQPIHPVASIGT